MKTILTRTSHVSILLSLGMYKFHRLQASLEFYIGLTVVSEFLFELVGEMRRIVSIPCMNNTLHYISTSLVSLNSPETSILESIINIHHRFRSRSTFARN